VSHQHAAKATVVGTSTLFSNATLERSITSAPTVGACQRRVAGDEARSLKTGELILVEQHAALAWAGRAAAAAVTVPAQKTQNMTGGRPPITSLAE
jgi:hypothetical protein